MGALAPITATSFYPTKPLGAFGDGGAIFTNDSELAETFRQLRSHGTQGSGDVAMRLGMTGRLDTLQAAVLLAKLEKFDDRLAECSHIAARYQRALDGAVDTPRDNLFRVATLAYRVLMAASNFFESVMRKGASQ